MKKTLFTVLWMLFFFAGGLVTYIHPSNADANPPKIQHNAVVVTIVNWLSIIVWPIVALILGICGKLPGTRRKFRRVYAQLPVPTGQASVSQSELVPDVQEALRIIDSVVTSGGFVRTPPRQWKPDLLVLYNTPVGPKNPMTSCSVFLTEDCLSVDFGERARFSSSKAVREMCGTLADKFSSLYGAENVMVPH